MAPQGGDHDTAWTFSLERYHVSHQTTVEFVAGSGRVPSRHRAVVALRPFLELEEPPPRRLDVGRDGSASVVEPHSAK